jgi:hypothetical protein
MIVAVTGGRDYPNKQLVQKAIKKIHSETPITLLVHGGANGADRLAKETAMSLGIQTVVFEANWGYYDRSAGPTRNINMLVHMKPDLLLAFPGNRGTAHCANAAEQRGIKVVEAVAMNL